MAGGSLASSVALSLRGGCRCKAPGRVTPDMRSSWRMTKCESAGNDLTDMVIPQPWGDCAMLAQYSLSDSGSRGGQAPQARLPGRA